MLSLNDWLCFKDEEEELTFIREEFSNTVDQYFASNTIDEPIFGRNKRSFEVMQPVDGFSHEQSQSVQKLQKNEPLPFGQCFSLDYNYICSYPVSQRYQNFKYIFEEEAFDDLPRAAPNGTSKSTTSAISRFDKWFSVLQVKPNQMKLLDISQRMTAMDEMYPPFIRVCLLSECDRGVILAHFIHQVTKQNSEEDLKANSKGLLMTAFQRAFRKFDAKFSNNTLSTMTSWKKNPSYSVVKKQCEEQCKKDAVVPLALQKKKQQRQWIWFHIEKSCTT